MLSRMLWMSARESFSLSEEAIRLACAFRYSVTRTGLSIVQKPGCASIWTRSC